MDSVAIGLRVVGALADTKSAIVVGEPGEAPLPALVSGVLHVVGVWAHFHAAFGGGVGEGEPAGYILADIPADPGHVVGEPRITHTGSHASPGIILAVAVDGAGADLHTQGVQGITPVVQITCLNALLTDIASEVAIGAGVGAHVGKRIRIQALIGGAGAQALPGGIVSIGESGADPDALVGGVISEVTERARIHATPSSGIAIGVAC